MNKMKRKIASIVLSTVLVCSFGLTACTAESGVFFEKDSMILYDGTQQTVEYELKGEAGDILSFKSSDENVVTVDENGKLTAVGIGVAEISVETANGYKDVCTVEVKSEWGEGVITLAPTCESAGTRTYTSAITGAEKTEELPALGHDYRYSGSVAASYEYAEHDVWVCANDETHVERHNFRGIAIDNSYTVNYFLQTIDGEFLLEDTEIKTGKEGTNITISDYETLPSTHVIDTEKSDAKTQFLPDDGSLVVNLYYKFASELSIKAYSLDGFASIETMNVAFKDDSVNATDTATLKILDKFGAEILSRTASASDGSASFDLSDVADNLSSYYAVFETGKTFSPEIKELSVDYTVSYDLAKIIYNAYLRKTGNADYDKTLSGRWGDISTATGGWANYYQDGVRFLLQSVQTLEVDEEGKVYNISDTATSGASYTKSGFFNISFDTETTHVGLKTVEVDLGAYNASGYSGPTLMLQNNNYYAFASGVRTDKTVSISTTNENWSDLLKSVGWFVTGDLKDGRSQGYVQFKAMRLSYNEVLFKEVIDVTEDLSALPKYSLSRVEGVNTVNVTFDFESVSAGDTATMYLLDSNGDAVLSRSVGITGNTASFNVGNISNINSYSAVFVTGLNGMPTITDVKANYTVIHDVATPYYQLHQYLSGAITTKPGEGDCNIGQGWGNYVVDGIQYQINSQSYFKVTSDGKFYNTTGSTATRTGINIIFTEAALANLKKIELDVEVSSVGGNTLQVQGNSYHAYKSGIKSATIVTVDLTNETDKSYFTNILKLIQWFPNGNIDENNVSLGYAQYKTLTLTYEKVLTATTV